MTQTKTFRLSAIIAGVILILAVLLPTTRANALSSSSLTLTDSRPSTSSSYTFDTSGLTTGSNIQCIQLDIGTAVDGTGDAGLDLTSIALTSESISSGDTWTVGSVDGSTDQLRATADAGGATPNASGNIVWGGIVNGSSADTTYFGLFETFNNVDCSTGGPIDSAVVTLIFKAGALVSLTIDPTLTFTVAGVATSQTVNGATTTVGSSATAIDFLNAVASGSPGVSAHDLTAGTNASGGYTLYIKHTALLTNGASDTITNWTGTNLIPTGSFATTAEAWGYTTDDATLTAVGDGVDRFTTPTNVWAGFSTSNEEVAYNGAAIASETTRVGHQVAVSSATEAGTYQTTVVYTAASTY